MKTAISLPDKLSNMAEEYAKEHGLTINDLYAIAVSEFIKKGKTIEKKDITKRINEICDNIDTSLNPQIKVAAKRILSGSEW